MANKSSPLLPSTNEILRKLGERIRFSRKRRKLTADMVASRAGMSPITLRNVEKGESGVTIGSYIAVMQVLGLEKDFNQLAQKDELGRELQDSLLNKPTKSIKLLAGKALNQSLNKNTRMSSLTTVRSTTTGSFISKNQENIRSTASGERTKSDSMKRSSDLVSLIKPRINSGVKIK